MIKNILDMLRIDDFYGKSEYIDIAKGINKNPETIKEIYKQNIRKWKRRQSK